MQLNIEYSFKCINEDTECVFNAMARQDRDIKLGANQLHISCVHITYHFHPDLVSDYMRLKHRQGVLDGKQAIVEAGSVPVRLGVDMTADAIPETIKVKIIGTTSNAYVCQITPDTLELFHFDDVNYVSHLTAGNLSTTL